MKNALEAELFNYFKGCWPTKAQQASSWQRQEGFCSPSKRKVALGWSHTKSWNWYRACRIYGHGMANFDLPMSPIELLPLCSTSSLKTTNHLQCLRRFNEEFWGDLNAYCHYLKHCSQKLAWIRARVWGHYVVLVLNLLSATRFKFFTFFFFINSGITTVSHINDYLMLQIGLF